MINREQEILTKIKAIIQDCAQQNENLLRDQNRINDIELKLFLAKAHFLASHIEILQQVQQTSPTNFQKSGIGHIPVYGVTKNTHQQHKSQNFEPDDFERNNPKRDEVKTNRNIDTILPKNSASQPAFLVNSGSGLTENIEQNSLNPTEEIRQSIAQIVEKEKTNIDLQATISLNDKWFFIKELFNGSTATYNEAIHLTNKCESFEDAERFLQRNYGVANQWSEKIKPLEKFYAILGRRFPK